MEPNTWGLDFSGNPFYIDLKRPHAAVSQVTQTSAFWSRVTHF